MYPFLLAALVTSAFFDMMLAPKTTKVGTIQSIAFVPGHEWMQIYVIDGEVYQSAVNFLEMPLEIGMQIEHMPYIDRSSGQDALATKIGRVMQGSLRLTTNTLH